MFARWRKRDRRLHTLKGSVMSTELVLKADVPLPVLQQQQAYAEQLEDWMSAYRPHSLICQINRLAGRDSVLCPEPVHACIRLACEVAEQSGGRFDPTIGVLSQRTYGFGTRQQQWASSQQVSWAKKRVDYRKVVLDGARVGLTEPGMALDLGGVGKGYAAGLLLQNLRAAGAESALVAVGGEIACCGRSWNIAIQDPDAPRYLAIAQTRAGQSWSVSTSGSYARFIDQPEQHHILQTATGRPNNQQKSLTLVEPGHACGRLDAWATAWFSQAADKSLQEASKQSIGALSITADQLVHMTPRFCHSFLDLSFSSNGYE